ncbi:MAG: ribbon-helix-helix protein, CopG family [Spirochaetaceae bacterium]|nr:ribbon-helix-helix protein, CopG family [Spirochaetaceae bacterium]
MSDRKNRTIYVLDSLMEKANTLARKKDRSVSRIIEYALADYLRKNGIDPGTEAGDDSAD